MAAEQSTRPPVLNPMQLWADLGLRALESSVATSQKIGDTVDRMTRAGAAPDAADRPDAGAPAASVSAAVNPAGLAPVSPVALMTQMHRAAFDNMQQGWLQWMSMVGTLATATTRRGLAPTSASASASAGAGQEQAAASIAAIDSPVDAAPLQAKSSSSARQDTTQARGESQAEHAHAAAEAPKRRPRTAAKRKSAARNS